MIRKEKMVLGEHTMRAELAIVHLGTPDKFKVTITWNDKQGIPYTKEQIVSIIDFKIRLYLRIMLKLNVLFIYINIHMLYN